MISNPSRSEGCIMGTGAIFIVIFGVKLLSKGTFPEIIWGIVLCIVGYYIFIWARKVEPTHIQCPYCKEKIKREATVCKHCGKEFVNPNAIKKL